MKKKPRKSNELAIMFADICRSSRLYEIMGNKEAKQLISNCLSKMAEITAEYYGTIVKTIGDELMCTFPDALLAVEAACSMQNAVEKMPVIHAHEISNLTLRIGIHYGSVVFGDDDIYGDAVNVAARMAAIAGPTRIMTTKETIDLLSPSDTYTVRYISTDRVKGKREVIQIHEIVCGHQDATFMDTVFVDTFTESLIPEARMELQTGNLVMDVDKDNPIVHVGRHSNNEIVIRNRHSSRYHFVIEYRSNKFLLRDHSMNGTYLVKEGGKRLRVLRQEVELIERGRIEVGKKPDITIINYNILR